MTPGIKWLASYPKSGNTWARLFLLNYHMAPDEPILPDALGQIQFCPADDAEWLINNATGMSPKDMPPPAPFFRLRTAFQQHYLLWCASIKRIPYLKTHSPNLVADHLFRMIDESITEKAVYFIRDPRDVAPSLAAHTGAGHDEIVDKMASPSYAVQRPIGTVSPIGNWSEHVKSWEEIATVIKYEDLPNAFEVMLEAFGLERDERFDKAVKFTDLKTLSKLEDEHGFGEGSNHTKFFGGTTRKLNKPQREKIEEAHGDVMRRYGYLT